MLDVLAKDTELDALRSIFARQTEGDPGLAAFFQGQHELHLPNKRRAPINELNRSQALLSLAFPCLFSEGRADFVEPRLRSIDYKDYIKHATRWHDGRFARHPTFRFIAFNTLMRSQARARSKFFVKQLNGTHEPLTQEQLIQALEHSEDPRGANLRFMRSPLWRRTGINSPVYYLTDYWRKKILKFSAAEPRHPH